MSTHTPADTRAFQMTKKTENELQQFLLGDLSVTQVVYGVSRACSGLDIRGICTHTHTKKNVSLLQKIISSFYLILL